MACSGSLWSWFRGRFEVRYSSDQLFVNKFSPPSLRRSSHGLWKLEQTSLQHILGGIMAGRVGTSLLNSLSRGNIVFRNKKCLRRSVVFLSRCHARSRSTSSISAAQPDLSSHLAGKTYADLYELSVKDPETFWGSIAKERLAWTKPFDQVTDCDLSSGKINWFLGGQLNVSGECCTFSLLHFPIWLKLHFCLSEVMSVFYLDWDGNAYIFPCFIFAQRTTFLSTVKSSNFLLQWLTENCLDVHVAKDPNRVALIWEKDEPGTEERITYRYIKLLRNSHVALPSPTPNLNPHPHPQFHIFYPQGIQGLSFNTCVVVFF